MNVLSNSVVFFVLVAFAVVNAGKDFNNDFNAHNKTIMKPPSRGPPPPHDYDSSKNYTSKGHDGANAGFDPYGALVKFKNGNQSISFRITKIRELYYNTTTMENFPVLPDPSFGLSKHDSDDHHNFQKFPLLKFTLSSVQNLTIGQVLFEHLVVTASPVPGTTVDIHIFVALNAGIAQIWDKNYTFATGSFKFSLEVDNWKFCSGCLKATSQQDHEAGHNPPEPRGPPGNHHDNHSVSRHLREKIESQEVSPHVDLQSPPPPTPPPKHYDANVLDIQLDFVATTAIQFGGDDDSKRNCTLTNVPGDYHNKHIHSNRSLVTLPSDYVVNGIPQIMPYGFPVVVYDNKNKGSVTFRFNKFNGTLYYDPVADVNTASTTTTTATSAPVSNPSSSSSVTGCFAGTETVELSSGEFKSIAEINVGDIILSANKLGETSYSAVVAVPHAKNSITAKFVQLTTRSGHSVKMTEDHLVLVSADCDTASASVSSSIGDKELIASKSVKLGMCLHTTSGMTPVISTETVTLNGLYTVVTKEEYVVVNGVLASPFSVNHVVTNAFYNIHRVIYHLFPQWSKAMNGAGIVSRVGEYVESLVPM